MKPLHLDMASESPMKDFRGVRTVLEANYFPKASGVPARDLVEKATWDDIQILPEIVSIVTSNDHGKELHLLNDLWGHWVEILPVIHGVVNETCLIAADMFQASTFNTLHGYYRVAANCLRSSVEQMTIAAHYRLRAEQKRKVLPEGPERACFETAHDDLQARYKDTPLWRIFQGEKNRIGWIRSLHKTLDDCANSRSRSGAIQGWEGRDEPIYLERAFGWTVKMWLLTYASCLILLRLAEPSTPKVEEIFSNAVVARVFALKRAADLLWETQQDEQLLSATRSTVL